MGYIIALVLVVLAVIIIAVYAVRLSREMSDTFGQFNQTIQRAQDEGQYLAQQAENIKTIASVQRGQAQSLSKEASEKSKVLQDLGVELGALSNQITYMKNHQWDLIQGAGIGFYEYAKEEVPKQSKRQKSILERTFEKQKARFRNKRKAGGHDE